MLQQDQSQVQSFQKGLRLYKKKKFSDALICFRKAIITSNIENLQYSDPIYLSYYGIALVMTDKNVKLGEKLCKVAVRNAPEAPEVFMNLGTVYERSNKKRRAINIFRSGYRRHKKHPDLLKSLQRLSPRQKSIVPFLDRDHIINKFTGIIFRRGFKALKPPRH